MFLKTLDLIQLNPLDCALFLKYVTSMPGRKAPKGNFPKKSVHFLGNVLLLATFVLGDLHQKMLNPIPALFVPRVFSSYNLAQSLSCFV